MTLNDTGGHTAAHNGHGGHHGPPEPSYTPASMTSHVLDRFANPAPQIKTWLSATGALLAIGVIGLIIKFVTVPDSRGWGYYAATVGFILSTFQAAPLAAIAARLTKGNWRRPFTRTAELFTAVGLLNVLLLIPLLMKLPVNHVGQRTIWFGWPGSPYVYEFLAFLFLPIVGLGVLMASSIPDWAAARDRGLTGGFIGRAAGWFGGMKQWRVIHAALTPLGAMYLAMFIFTGLLFSTDVSMALVPGWVDAIYPAQYSIAGIQGGIATLIIALSILRRTSFNQYFTEYVGHNGHLVNEAIWGLAKLLLAFSLLWFYFWWSAFILFWYGKQPHELALIELLMFGGPYLVPFLLAWFGSFGIPLLSLMWNRVRTGITGPLVVSCIVLVGNFFNQVRLIVGPWSLSEHGGHRIEHMPAFMAPDLADILIIPGFIGGAVFVYLLAMRYTPQMALWEMREGLLYKKVRQYFKARVAVVAKPE